MNYEIVRRKVERESHCRGCDKTLFKGNVIIYTYSHRNRGQNIIFCMSCAELIGKLVEEITNEQ